jgi:hypothetical protein
VTNQSDESEMELLLTLAPWGILVGAGLYERLLDRSR